jgi:hypothetical protein
MIRYTLRCARGHGFESWFQNSGAYDSQRRRKLVTCPVCDSAEVEKAPMAPQVGRSRLREETPATQAKPQPQPQAPLMTGEAGELRAKLRELREFVKKNADDVGEQFPAEARKMHYGDIEHRAIYGKASPGEARELVDEGIDITPLPPLPDDSN